MLIILAACSTDSGWTLGVEMVRVAGGTFSLGNDDSQYSRPEHDVTLSDFYMGKYEVTQEQYEEVMGRNPSKFKGANLPVEQVNLYDAVEFCNALSEKEGLDKVYTIDGTDVTQDIRRNGYRLPTEAEWEYAARGGKLSKNYTYSGSNTAGEVAWYNENSESKTHAVGTKKPNELGLYDMSGNVWEWCWDWWDENYYSVSPASDPEGASSGSLRMYRGGCWQNDTETGNLRSANRNNTRPDTRGDILGFRLVRR